MASARKGANKVANLQKKLVIVNARPVASVGKADALCRYPRLKVIFDENLIANMSKAYQLLCSL